VGALEASELGQARAAVRDELTATSRLQRDLLLKAGAAMAVATVDGGRDRVSGYGQPAEWIHLHRRILRCPY
jgi:hypothetical protein